MKYKTIQGKVDNNLLMDQRSVALRLLETTKARDAKRKLVPVRGDDKTIYLIPAKCNKEKRLEEKRVLEGKCRQLKD